MVVTSKVLSSPWEYHELRHGQLIMNLKIEISRWRGIFYIHITMLYKPIKTPQDNNRKYCFSSPTKRS